MFDIGAIIDPDNSFPTQQPLADIVLQQLNSRGDRCSCRMLFMQQAQGDGRQPLRLSYLAGQ